MRVFPGLRVTKKHATRVFIPNIKGKIMFLQRINLLTGSVSELHYIKNSLERSQIYVYIFA